MTDARGIMPAIGRGDQRHDQPHKGNQPLLDFLLKD